MDMHRICKNCGAEFGLHHVDTNQCPKNGHEAPVGRRQYWATTVFEEQPQISQDAANLLLASCKEVRLMLNTALKDYRNEPWAKRLEANIALAEKSES